MSPMGMNPMAMGMMSGMMNPMMMGMMPGMMPGTGARWQGDTGDGSEAARGPGLKLPTSFVSIIGESAPVHIKEGSTLPAPPTFLIKTREAEKKVDLFY